MSSAANAKPVVFVVGVADAGASDCDGKAADDGGAATVGKGDAAGRWLDVVDPQAASSSEVATTNEARLRSCRMWCTDRLQGVT